MSLDKISEDRLFQTNTKDEIVRWAKGLKYFHYMRARGGHNCEGDSICVYFKYDSLEDLSVKLSKLGVSLNKIDDNFMSFDPFKSYSLDDLDNLKITIPQFPEYEQPQYVEIFGQKVHVWVLDGRFEISVSGTKDGKAYKVTEDDYLVCLELEKQFDKLDWNSVLDEDIVNQIHCISKKKYPELFE